MKPINAAVNKKQLRNLIKCHSCGKNRRKWSWEKCKHCGSDNLSIKRCSRCLLDKEISDFNNDKAGKLGKHHYCKDCIKATRSPYSYSKSKSTGLSRAYGLTKEQLAVMYKKQNGKCAICREPKPVVSVRKGLYVDHCHRTKKIRGLLCPKCNTMLGMAGDNIVVLKNAIQYIKKHTQS